MKARDAECASSQGQGVIETSLRVTFPIQRGEGALPEYKREYKREYKKEYSGVISANSCESRLVGKPSSSSSCALIL
jgi:hypothetical protein